MLFNSPAYGIFLVGCFLVFWLLHKHRFLRALFLACASYAFYFYGTYDTAREQPVPLPPLWWAALCLGIIFVGSTLDFFIGLWLDKTDDSRKRKALLLVSIVYYLGILAIFKYWNFAADSFSAVAHAAGWKVNPLHLRLVLPFGISFFTFETMSYTIDVYRRQIRAVDRYLDYLLFVSFFPHLVAGPIVRPSEMLPQFLETPKADPDIQLCGLMQIATGVAKKVVIGDYLAANLVSRVFENPERYSSIEALVAVYAYAVQLYADFSGYTDIAVGSAKLFGYQLPQNFNAPYAAHNLQEFWRRWHMSLSRWLRDYLYVPLGGSRGGTFATYRNLMITMVLGGLWHGASWNFVIWGALHGAALALTRAWQRIRGESPSVGVMRVWGTVLTFHYVCFAWIFFRAPTLEHARLLLARMGAGTFGADNISRRTVLLIVAGLALHFVPGRLSLAIVERAKRLPALALGVLFAAVAIGLHLAAGAKAEPFVYGQF